MFHRVVIELTDSTPIPTTVLRYDVLHRMQRSAERSHTAVWGFGLANGRLRLVVRGDEANAASLGRRIRVGTRLSLPPSLRPRQSWSLVEPLADADLVAGIAWAHGAVLQHAPTVFASPWSSHRDLLGFRRAPFFDAASFAEVIGHVPPWLTQPSFQMLRPMGQTVKMMRLFQNLGNDRFLTFFRALETWVNDNVAIPKGFFVDLITKLYRKNALVEGRFRLGPEPVVLEEIQVPTLTICAKKDHIVPPDSATRGHHCIGAEDKRLEVFEGGHIGVVVGGNARRQLWPLLEEWFTSHVDDEVQA